MQQNLATDNWRHNNAISSGLYSKAAGITHDYSRRFKSPGAEIAKNVAAGSAGMVASGGKFGGFGRIVGAAAGAALNTGLGAIKYDQAADHFKQKFGPEIARAASQQALSSAELYGEMLRQSVTGYDQAMLGKLQDGGVISGGSVVKTYKIC